MPFSQGLNILYGTNTGNTGLLPIQVDNSSQSLVAIDNNHSHIHSGHAYSTTALIEDVPAGSTSYFQLKTPVMSLGIVHFKESIITTNAQKLKITLIESPTLTNGTTEQTSVNRNRYQFGNAVSAMKIYTNPTNVSGGTILSTAYILGESSPGKSSTGGDSFNLSLEWLFKPNTSYVAKLENLGSTSADIHVWSFWYEYI